MEFANTSANFDNICILFQSSKQFSLSKKGSFSSGSHKLLLKLEVHVLRFRRLNAHGGNVNSITYLFPVILPEHILYIFNHIAGTNTVPDTDPGDLP